MLTCQAVSSRNWKLFSDTEHKTTSDNNLSILSVIRLRRLTALESLVWSWPQITVCVEFCIFFFWLCGFPLNSGFKTRFKLKWDNNLSLLDVEGLDLDHHKFHTENETNEMFSKCKCSCVVQSPSTLLGTPVHLHVNGVKISQSCGSSTMQNIVQMLVKRFS